MKASERLRQLFLREYPNLAEGKTRFLQLQKNSVHGVGVTTAGRFPFVLVLPKGSIEEPFVSELVQAVPMAEMELESVLDSSRSQIVASVLHFRDFTRAAEIVLNSIVEALENPTDANSVPALVTQFINLFNSRRALSEEEVTGFFGELTTLAIASEPNLLVSCWHSKTEERFDFNAGSSRLEVKTTVQGGRTHSFSSGQVPAPAGVSVQIASLLTQMVPHGSSVFDVFEKVRVSLEPSALRRFDEIFLRFVSGDEALCEELLFDFQMAQNSFEIYDAESIPQPPLVPGVLRMKWECDLSYAEPARFLNTLSKLVVAE